MNGPNTNSTLLETDERLRYLGYEIEDLGCCKVIRHHSWGTNTYVGCIFTDAPYDDPVILRILSMVKNDEKVRELQKLSEGNKEKLGDVVVDVDDILSMKKKK